MVSVILIVSVPYRALTSHRDPYQAVQIVIYVDETNGYRTLTAHEGGPSVLACEQILSCSPRLSDRRPKKQPA